MTRLICTILVALFWGQTFCQEEQIFPDYVAIHNQETFRKIVWTDNLTGQVVRTATINDGKIAQETFNNYQPAFGKYPIDGVFHYQYTSGRLPTERLYHNAKGDTLRVKYFFSGNKLTKRKAWEYERRTKLRKGAPEYGDGKGCIPAEEDLIRYRKWVKRGIFTYAYEDTRIKEIRTLYDYSNNHDVVNFAYQDNKLIIRKEVGKRTKETHWEERYTYTDRTVTMTKAYFITYWGKIPPTETWTTELDAAGREVRITKELLGNTGKDVVERFYDDRGNLTRVRKLMNGSGRGFDYGVTYE